MNLADELDRRAAVCEDESLAGLLTAAAWHLRRMTLDLSRATGRAENVVRLSEGLDDGYAAPGAVPGAVAADPRPTRPTMRDNQSTDPRQEPR